MVVCVQDAGVRVEIDESMHKPGFKFNHWELRGVPLRIEMGPKDFEKQNVACRCIFRQCCVCCR